MARGRRMMREQWTWVAVPHANLSYCQRRVYATISLDIHVGWQLSPQGQERFASIVHLYRARPHHGFNAWNHKGGFLTVRLERLPDTLAAVQKLVAECLEPRPQEAIIAHERSGPKNPPGALMGDAEPPNPGG